MNPFANGAFAIALEKPAPIINKRFISQITFKLITACQLVASGAMRRVENWKMEPQLKAFTTLHLHAKKQNCASYALTVRCITDVGFEMFRFPPEIYFDLIHNAFYLKIYTTITLHKYCAQ